MRLPIFNRATRSLCPVCLRAIDGRVVSRGKAVYLEKSCPEHGPMEGRIWPDGGHYEWMRTFRLPAVRPEVAREPIGDCPRGCGICTRHLRKTTLVEIELTRRCNMRCPVCFMGAEEGPDDPGLEAIRSMYASILEEMGPHVSIQLTGGEPTIRGDLPEIVRLGASSGFSAIEINTNGLALSRKPGLVAALKEAGASGIYLQFDGLTTEVYRSTRGADLLADKLQVIERCREAGLQAVLAMTVVKGINEREIGKVLEFALQNIDVVAGLALQPVFLSGRFEVETPDRLSMGDVIFLLAEQSRGLIGPYDLWPLGCSHPLCSAGVFLVESEGKGFIPSSRLISREEYIREFDPRSPQGSVFADLLAGRGEYTGRGLSIVTMNYMDAWTFDLERLQECSMTVKTADLRTVPFCAYHLTNRSAFKRLPSLSFGQFCFDVPRGTPAQPGPRSASVSILNADRLTPFTAELPKKDIGWVANSRTKKTNCSLCGYLCGLTAHIAGEKIARLEPDPNRYPYNTAIVKGCARGRRNLELLDHPMRLNYPMRRVGERGSGRWERISWDQALDEIAARLFRLKEDYGPETLATSIGGPHTVYWPLHRFMNLFGSPNNMGIGQICWNPHIWADAITFGWPLDNELDPERTSCAILWGVNPAESDNSLFWRTVKEYGKSGAPLIVVDPRRTRTAVLTSRWLPIMPGSDCALALGLLNVIVTKQLYDRPFIDTWCQGFESLVRHVAPYTPAVVEALTGLSAASIVEAASLYAGGKPATLITGRGIDQIGPNSFQTHRALALLRAVTGNVDLAGASHLTEMPDFTSEVDLELTDRLSESQRKKQLGGDRWLLQSYPGYDVVHNYIRKQGKRLPVRYLTSAHPNLVWRAMLEGKPYPVRAMIILASNPLLSQADSRLVYRALKSLDLLVVIDLYQTPTAMLADYVLPAAGSLERAVVQTNAGTANIAYGGDRAVDPVYERRVNFDFWRGLAVRMGQEVDWPWKTFQESLEEMLAPAGISWQDFCETGLYCPPRYYGKYGNIDEGSELPAGFATPSNKIELYSQILEGIHGQPLPVHISLADESKEYPLTLITGARTQPYYSSAFRQVDSLRRLHPEPLAEMSAATAQKLGLAEGQAVWVESPQGRACFRLKIALMRDDVVSVEYGWWQPELASAEPELGGLWRSNANLLTNADAQKYDNLLGQWTYNGLPCRVYLAEESDL